MEFVPVFMAPLNLKIASPCSVSWASMVGDERVRHCGECRKNVYNFKEMTRTEIEVLLLKTEGRVCAQLYQRKDGTLLTKDCPVALAAARRKLVAGAMLSAAMVLTAFTFLQKALLSGTAWAEPSTGPGVVKAVPVNPVKAQAIILEKKLRQKPVVGPVIDKIDPPINHVAGGLRPPERVPQAIKVTK